MRPRPYSAAKVPQSSAQPNERLGRVPRVNHSSPLARFQGRKRRKAPEGFPKPTSRSAKREDVGVETFRGLPMGSQALTA